MANSQSDSKVLQSASVGNSDFSLVESESKFRVMKDQNGSSATLSVSRDKASSEADFKAQVRMAEDFQ